MIKQVIVIRRDLKMRRGKEISQGAHASMAFLSNDIVQLDEHEPIKKMIDSDVYQWLENGHKKVTVHVRTEREILALHEKAKELGLRSYYIVDEGLTEFNGVNTITALAIGPNKSDDIDKITGNLPLY